MYQQWGKPVLLVLALLTLLIPGVRRLVFVRLLKNRFIRNTGLRLLLASPFLRDRVMTRILPPKAAPAEASYPNQPNQDVI